jgi:hypothetical protein
MMLGVTKRVIVDRISFFLPTLSLIDWRTVLGEELVAPLEEISYVVHLSHLCLYSGGC